MAGHGLRGYRQVPPPRGGAAPRGGRPGCTPRTVFNNSPIRDTSGPPDFRDFRQNRGFAGFLGYPQVPGGTPPGPILILCPRTRRDPGFCQKPGFCRKPRISRGGAPEPPGGSPPRAPPRAPRDPPRNPGGVPPPGFPGTPWVPCRATPPGPWGPSPPHGPGGPLPVIPGYPRQAASGTSLRDPRLGWRPFTLRAAPVVAPESAAPSGTRSPAARLDRSAFRYRPTYLCGIRRGARLRAMRRCAPLRSRSSARSQRAPELRLTNFASRQTPSDLRQVGAVATPALGVDR